MFILQVSSAVQKLSNVKMSTDQNNSNPKRKLVNRSYTGYSTRARTQVKERNILSVVRKEKEVSKNQEGERYGEEEAPVPVLKKKQNGRTKAKFYVV